ncbi:TetR/AcrR family transcriptional regulator [Brevundimonas sp.]|jgi:AcrR family transcriptional regulator|uniref:TetR/AcrR family transcriptional regulator n=1 Tax=Brevundimonas sp. TaxID=1871086 RepID=UPI0037C0BC9D
MPEARAADLRPLRGRPRGFNRETVLAQAADLFARDGYEGISVADLAAELGLNHPSLYAAFGPKSALYREALDWAEKRWADQARQALSAPFLMQAMSDLLDQQVAVFADRRHQGCMLTSALQTHARDHALEAKHARRLRAAMIGVVRERLDRATRDGELDRSRDGALLATFIVGQIHGLSTLARDGATPEMLRAVAGIALQGFGQAARIEARPMLSQVQNVRPDILAA